ncbi:MAG TPA: hypothetical protein VGQ13_10155 [Nitrososphaera sp.]|nr:hypothetical protein [Nitrososphaera sp.]
MSPYSSFQRRKIFLEPPDYPAYYLQGMRGSGKSATAERICEGYYQYHRFVVLDWWSAIDLENLFWCVPGKLDKDRKDDPHARSTGYPVLIIKPKETVIEPRNPLCRCGVPLAEHNPQSRCKRPSPLIKVIDDTTPLQEIILKAYKGRRICILSPGLYKDPRHAVSTLGRYLGELPLLVRQEILPTTVSMILLLREMGNIIPQGLQNYGRGLEAQVKRPMQALIREARHLRIVLVGDFQRSSDIASTVVAQRDFMIFKKITTDLIPETYTFVNDSINYARAVAHNNLDWETYYSLPSLSNLKHHECIVVFPDNAWVKIELAMAGFLHKKPSDSWPTMANCFVKFLDAKEVAQKLSEKVRKKELEGEHRLEQLKQIHRLRMQEVEWQEALVQVKWEGYEVFDKPEPATAAEKALLSTTKHRVLSNARMAYNRVKTRGLLDPPILSGANANSVVGQST